MKKLVLFFLVAAFFAATFSACGSIGANTMTLTLQPNGEESIYLAGSGTVTIDWGDGSAKETHTLTGYTLEYGLYDITGFPDRAYGYSHQYSTTSVCTITINGENITAIRSPVSSVTAIDVSKITTLQFLDCTAQKLTSLDVSKNIELIFLDCSSNQLNSLDVSRNTKLSDLRCSSNQLSNFDVSKNTELIYLYCRNNQLTSLDVSKCVKLQALSIQGNQFSSAALNALFGTLPVIRGGGVVMITDNPGTNSCNQKVAEDRGWRVSTRF